VSEANCIYEFRVEGAEGPPPLVQTGNAAKQEVELRLVTVGELSGRWRLPFDIDSSTLAVRVNLGHQAWSGPVELDGRWVLSVPLSRGTLVSVGLLADEWALGASREVALGAASVDLTIARVGVLRVTVSSTAARVPSGAVRLTHSSAGQAPVRMSKNLKEGTGSVEFVGLAFGDYQMEFIDSVTSETTDVGAVTIATPSVALRVTVP
jgi:hypothetical protein